MYTLTSSRFYVFLFWLSFILGWNSNWLFNGSGSLIRFRTLQIRIRPKYPDPRLWDVYNNLDPLITLLNLNFLKHLLSDVISLSLYLSSICHYAVFIDFSLVVLAPYPRVEWDDAFFTVCPRSSDPFYIVIL